MRLLSVLLVIVNLLLRAAAVPHGHLALGDATCLAGRPHVHLGAHAERHAHGRGHDGRGHGHRHVHRGLANPVGNGPPVSAAAPRHDADAVCLGDGASGLIPASRPSPGAAVRWLVLPAHTIVALPPDVEPRPRHVRPPGTGAATIHSLLPHVLRV